MWYVGKVYEHKSGLMVAQIYGDLVSVLHEVANYARVYSQDGPVRTEVVLDEGDQNPCANDAEDSDTSIKPTQNSQL